MAGKQGSYTFKGSDAARARALAKARRTPKFTIGEVVLDAFGDIGAIDGIYADLRAVEEAGVIGDAAEWRRGLDVKPRTPVTGIHYSLVYGHGTGIAGERDLKRAPAGAVSRP